MLLKGRSALITGAGRNIGRAIALEMAREGASIIVNVRRDLDQANAVVREIRDIGGNAIVSLADVTCPEQVAEMVNKGVQEFGKIDILVNNAVLRAHVPFAEMSPETWHKVVDTDLNGPFYCAKSVVEGMVARHYGRIINIIGTVGHTGYPNSSASSAGKAGLMGLTRSLAAELAPQGITVNGVSPGPINTVRSEAFSTMALGPAVRTTPVGRIGEPREVARACVYLASDDAAYVTGHILCINGGSYM